MRKVALVFVLAVLAPSLALAWLAIRSVRDQELILERQRFLLCQGIADKMADTVAAFLSDKQAGFRQQVDDAVSHGSADDFRAFNKQLQAAWPLAQIGFVTTTNGNIVSPSPSDGTAAVQFVLSNSKFLGNQESAQIYSGNLNSGFYNNSIQAPRNISPQQTSANQLNNSQAPSRLSVGEANFRQLIGDSSQGSLARFVDNRLNVLFWYRPPRQPGCIFGAQLNQARLRQAVAKLVADGVIDASLQSDVCLAILDDSAKPVATTQTSFSANWKKPFVATELGETLPHWEAAVYLIDPAQLSKSAAAIKWTLGLMIALLVVAIGIGGWLVLNSVRSEILLARQKTDFVSNVSHELKTPLTSIRMFTEMLVENRVSDPGKQRNYLNIISAEASRLTRLINNVLDFSRLERGEMKYQLRPCDVRDVARSVESTFRPHLEAAGFEFQCATPERPLPAEADPDALAQIIVNLLSNAEKYSNGRKEISLIAIQTNTSRPEVEIQVLDRGTGVPPGTEKRVFEKFYRAHDSLGSGVEGSGLGLTIARHIARAHGGDVVFRPREGGGSCFVVKIPLAESAS